MDLGVLLESPQRSKYLSRWGHARALSSRALAAESRFPSRGSRDLWLSLEAFPQGCPTCHHSQCPPDISVLSRETCFPCTASTFKPRIDSHYGATWDSPVGKPRGKATDPLIHVKGSVTLLLQLGRKVHVHAPLEIRTDSPGKTPEEPLDPSHHWRGFRSFRHRLHTRS